MGHLGKIRCIADLPGEKLIAGYIRKAAGLNETGVKVPAQVRPAKKKELVVPDYFRAALRKNRRAGETFAKFAYSHKKEYVQWIAEAKREETRNRRIATALEWLSAGKSRNWKWEKY